MIGSALESDRCHGFWRLRRAETSIEVLPDLAAHVDESEAALRRLLLQRALAKLTARQRAVIVLRFFEDLSVAETADALGPAAGYAVA